GGERKRDPALAGDHAFDPEVRVDDRDVRPGDAAERAAEDHRGQPDPAHRIAERMRRLRRFADRAQYEAGARAVEEPGDEEGERDRDVDHRMLAEERRADEGHVGENGNVEAGALAELFLRIADAGQGREARAEKADSKAGRGLAGVE